MTISLCSRLANDFSKNARVKGDAYAASGRVSITSGSDTALSATVLGSDRYEVEMKCRVDAHGVAVEASCDCPMFFDQGTPCKHMWAVLRRADRGGHLSQAAQHQGRVHLEAAAPRSGRGFRPRRERFALALRVEDFSRPSALAEAILSEERGGLRGLERDDLELLLS